MNGEDVFGSKIRVLYSSQIEFPSQHQQQHQQQQQQLVPIHQGHLIGITSAGPPMPSNSPPNNNYSNTNITPRRKTGGKRSQSSIEQSNKIIFEFIIINKYIHMF